MYRPQPEIFVRFSSGGTHPAVTCITLPCAEFFGEAELLEAISQIVLGRARLSAVPPKPAKKEGFSPRGTSGLTSLIHYEMTF